MNAMQTVLSQLTPASPDKVAAYLDATRSAARVRTALRGTSLAFLAPIVLAMFGVAGLSLELPLVIVSAALFLIVAVGHTLWLAHADSDLGRQRYLADIDRIDDAAREALFSAVEDSFTRQSAAYQAILSLEKNQGALSERQRDIVMRAVEVSREQNRMRAFADVAAS